MQLWGVVIVVVHGHTSYTVYTCQPTYTIPIHLRKYAYYVYMYNMIRTQYT